jgi:hypothetical protein
MHSRLEGLALGLLGGAAGLAAMQLVQRLTRPLVKQRAPQPTDVFKTERSMSLIGLHHREDESATDALGRISYEKLAHREPSAKAQNVLSWAFHLGFGLFSAAAFGALRAEARRHTLRDGALFGAALWLLFDELAMPLLGLADKPSQYHPTRHLQSLATHLGYGIATAGVSKAASDALHPNGFHSLRRRMS